MDSAGNAYVVGRTVAQDFPTVNPIQGTNASSSTSSNDAFVTKINAAGSSFVYSTYIGGANEDDALDVAVDLEGNVYVTGFTTSTNFPTINPIQTGFAGGTDAFVTKINAAGSAIVYSTYLGGSGSGPNGTDSGWSIAVDPVGQAHVAGSTSSPNFPTANAIQTYSGNNDIFVSKISSIGGLIYSTYLGRSSSELGYGAALNSANELYVTGETGSSNFPLTNPIQSGYGGGLGDMFVIRINDGPAPTPTPGASPIPTATPSPAPSPTPVGLVISQVYGGGGTAGAIYRNSYVELFNRDVGPIVVNAYAVALGLGTNAIDRSYGRSSSQGIVIQPGQYLLVRMGSGGSSGAELPTPDVDAQNQQPPFPSSFFGLTGKLALTTVGSDNSIFTNCPLGAPGLLDFVGFGPTNCFEGSAPINGLSATAAALRKSNGCTETNNNANDFAIGAPNPRNSSSPFNPCFVAPTPTPTPPPTPTPSLISISGRAVSETGAGLRAIVVVVTRDDGVARTATTSSFGVFIVDGLESGRTYTITSRSKRYRFSPQIIAPTTNVSDLILVGLV